MRAMGWIGWRTWLGTLIVGVIGTWAVPALASAATYYLSGSGSDSNPGTLAEPWRTFSHANGAVKAGDTVYVREGTYGTEGVSTNLNKVGTGAAPISWLAYPGDATPVFHGRLHVEGAHNRVSGINFKGPTGLIGGSQDVPVWLNAEGDELDHSEVSGSEWHAGVFVSHAPGFSVDHDYIRDNGFTEKHEHENEDQGVYVDETASGGVWDNLIVHSAAFGIQLETGTNEVVVNHNTIVDSGRGGVIVAHTASKNLVANNIVANNNEYGIRGYNLTGTGNEALDNLVWNQSVNTTGTGMTFSGTINSSPLFVGETDYHLQSGSPAIEAAGKPTVADDLEGNLRGEPSDLGAYEYVPSRPVQVGASSATVDASTTLTIAKPTGTVSGDVMIAEVVSRGGAAISAPEGWSEIRNTAVSGSDHMTTFARAAGASEPSSYTFSSTDAVGKAGGIVGWEGVDTTSPIEESSGATGTGTTMTAASVTTTASNSPVMMMVGVLGAATTTPPVGFTESWDIGSNGKYKASGESSYAIQASAGASGSKSATLSTTGGGWEAQLIALRPE